MDTFEFVDARTVRSTIAFHITVPDEAPVLKNMSGTQRQSMVPLMLLDKASLSYRFRMCDDEGHSLPRLRSRECSMLERHFLIAATEALIGDKIPRTPWLADHPDGLASAFREITTSEYRDGERVYEEMRSQPWGLSLEQANRLFSERGSADFFRLSVKVLSGCHILCALIPKKPGTECMVKITTDLANNWDADRKRPWRGVFRLFGWETWKFMTTPPAGDPRSYHCEVWVPGGVEIHPRSRGLTPRPPELLKYHEGYLGRHCFHAAAHGFTSDTDYRLDLKLRSRAVGWMLATLVTAVTVLVLLVVGYMKSGDLVIAKTGASSAINLVVLLTSIFLAVGAASITVLARSSSGAHALEDRMLVGLRGVSWCIPVICFAAVLTLFCINTSGNMECAFTVLFWAECLILALLLIPAAIRIVSTLAQWVRECRAEFKKARGLL
ncbi:hypothetical protein [Streptomyces griseocarneus]|uniref:hypothetical protein n=1 Tax=Streptomyces griseocarneus TaxID=51201 RepID=UPI00167E37DA|nr:hypothetical protein [Streptomyces griseocarneus]MBZ6476733.1 hypothetical protein [Streptomyces griseocarneus]